MSYTSKTIIFWTLTVIFTIIIAVYQRKTGPTYPKTGVVEFTGEKVGYYFLTSFGGEGDAESYITVPDKSVTGTYKYKRFKSGDDWTTTHMRRDGDKLIIALPHQPPAGKLEYIAFLHKDGELMQINEKPIVIRFKGAVPKFVLYTHILMMFFAMIFSTRTGIEVLIKGKYVYAYALTTTILLFTGGLILGSVMQKYAFGDYWAGWPFGQDMTDNKTLVAFIFWLVAVIRLWRNREKTGWALVAAIVLLTIYLIPHSFLGSELDYSTGEVVTGK